MKRHQVIGRDVLALGIVLLVAGLLRLGEAGSVEFFHDEAMVAMLAQEMADGQTFPLVGIVSSVGIPNPPHSIYAMLPPFLFTDDPLIATLYVAALNVLGVGLLWWIGHRYFTPLVGLVAGLVYALNPWAILYSRKIWAQDYLTPFLLLALVLGLLGFVEKRRWAQVLCLPVLLFALQIHFAGWAFLPLYLILLWIGRSNLSRRTILLSLGLSLLVMLPYAFGLAQTLIADPDRLGTAMSRAQGGDPAGWSLAGEALTFTAYMATGLGLETWVAPLELLEFNAQVPPLPALWVIVGLLALTGSVFGLVRYRVGGLLVAAWGLLPLLVFVPGWTTVYPHYFIGALPALALLTAFGFIAILNGAAFVPIRRSATRAILLASFAALLLTWGWYWRGLTRYVDTNDIALGPGTSGYTTPVRYLLPVRDAVRDKADVIVFSRSADPLFDVEAARWPVMLRDSASCVRTLPGDGTMWVVPPNLESAAVIASPDGSGFFGATLAAGQAYPTRSDAAYTVLEAVALSGLAELNFLAEPLRFDLNGSVVLLNGYALNRESVTLEWVLPNTPGRLLLDRSTDYQYFVHFLGADGERLTQVDAQFWQGRHWCEGDALFTRQVVELPAATTALRIGLYRLGVGRDAGQIYPADLLDAMGNPAGNWADIPLDSSVNP